MKLVSVLNMSPSGMHLNFYSLTLHELKLISSTCSFVVAATAGCRLSVALAQKNVPSSHLIQGLDLITDLSWTTSVTAEQSPFLWIFLLNLHEIDGILSWVSFHSPMFHEHNKSVSQHSKITSHGQRTRELRVNWYYYQQLLLSLKSFIMTFIYCHWFAPI